ncbi:MAG: hypothetical protein AAF720_05785 [Pseudomonadota bacterium]
MTTAKVEKKTIDRDLSLEQSGRGLILFSFFVGICTALGAYYLHRVGLGVGWAWSLSPLGDATPYHAMEDVPIPASIAITQTLAVFALCWLLLAERTALLRSMVPSAVIAAILAFPTHSLASYLAIHLPQYASTRSLGLTLTPLITWFGFGLPLCVIMMSALAKTFVLGQGGRTYTSFFFHSVTLPLVVTSAGVFAMLSLLLVSTWTGAMSAIAGASVKGALQQNWVIPSVAIIIIAATIGITRSARALLGAYRYALLFSARLILPLLAVLSVALLVLLAVRGSSAFIQLEQTSILLLGFSAFAMLAVNGIYQNGEDAPPPTLLRVTTIITALSLPLFAGLSAYASWTLANKLGITPFRYFMLGLNGLALIYSVILLISVATEVKWRTTRWMPTLQPLNLVTVGLFSITLISLSIPVLNPWKISAKSQETRLLSGAIAVQEFDFGYLAFELGAAGKEVLERLSQQTDHPEAAIIKAKISTVSRFNTYSDYKKYQAGLITPPSENNSVTFGGTNQERTLDPLDPFSLPLVPDAASERN